MAEYELNWNDRVHLCLRSGRRGVRNAQLFTGTLDEAIHAALARAVDERDRLSIKYEFSSRRLSWTRIAELASRPDFPVLIRAFRAVIRDIASIAEAVAYELMVVWPTGRPRHEWLCSRRLLAQRPSQTGVITA